LRNGLVGEVTVVGFDLLPQTVELIYEGAIAATIDQAPERQGFEAVNMLVQFLNGEELEDVDTGVGIYTIENIDDAFAEEEEAVEGVSLEDFALAERIQAKLDAGEDLVIRVSYHDVSNEFAPFIRAGVERAAEELGVDARMIGPVGADADVQVSEIETLLDSVDGLAVSSVSTDALAPVIDRALELGIPVVTFNTDNPDSNRLAFAGQDLVESGRAAGHLMAEQLGGEGNVIITTLDAAAQWSIDRETGAREALAEYEGINVLTTVNTGTEPQEIYSNIENAMLANPNVDGILSLECCSNPAAGEYVLRNGLVGEVTVVGFDLLPQTLELIQEGAILATIDQAPEVQGFEAVNMLVQFLGGETIADVDTGVGVYTIENLDEVLQD
ncbi:MAG: sugar ABC transporter substrate-binding protein, partial [Phototrophicaceae bacterium]